MAACLCLTTTCVFFMNNAAGMLTGGLARAGAGLLGLHAYNKSPQGKAHKALAERRELEGNGDVVFLPREVLQSFGQSEAPAGGEASSSAAGMEKALGVTDTDVVKSTKEVMIDREKYERAARENPTFRAAAEAYVRYGSEGRTFSETAADIRDSVSDPINAETPFARSARAVRDRKIQALKDAGADDRTAEAGGYIWAKSVLRRAYNLGENEFGVLRDDALTPEQLDNLNVRGGQAEEAFGGDVYGQPMNAGVDLNQEVTGVVVTPTMDEEQASRMKGGEDKRAFVNRIAGNYVNQDTGWTLELSISSVKHAISTAFRKDNAIKFEKWLQIIEGLPEFLKFAKLIESHNDKKEAPDVEKIHRFFVPARLFNDDAYTYTVMITVKEENKRMRARLENIYEAHDARAVKKYLTATPNHNDSITNHQDLNPSGTFRTILRDVLDNVKDNDGNLYFQSVRNDTPPVRESLTRKPDSAQAKVVHLPEKAVPAFDRIKDFRNWALRVLMDGGDGAPVTIRSTGAQAVFTASNVRASLKRSRSETHRNAYAALREMISLAEYDHFEPADAKHLHLRGQDVYYSALSVGDRLYSVRLKLDVPPAGYKDGGRVVYKDHRLAEITIAPALYGTVLEKTQGRTQEAGAIKMAPALYHGMPNNGVPMQEAGAISTVSLGVLWGNVKPSNLEDGHLQQKRRGQIQIGPNGEGAGRRDLLQKLKG